MRVFQLLKPELIFALGLTFLVAACATETPEQATGPEADFAAAEAGLAAAVREEDEEELVCREELRTGTNFKRRVCLTQAEWDAQGRGQRRESSEVIRTRAEREAVTGAAGGQTVGPPGATFP